MRLEELLVQILDDLQQILLRAIDPDGRREVLVRGALPFRERVRIPLGVASSMAAVVAIAVVVVGGPRLVPSAPSAMAVRARVVEMERRARRTEGVEDVPGRFRRRWRRRSVGPLIGGRTRRPVVLIEGAIARV
jgi:hypothetical protein